MINPILSIAKVILFKSYIKLRLEIQKSLKIHLAFLSSKFMEFRSLRSLALILPFKFDLHSYPQGHYVEKRASLMKDGVSVAT